MCSCKEFMNSKPRTYHGDDRVVTLPRWFEKTESILKICTCLDEFKVIYVICTFVDSNLSWWNNHIKTLTLPFATCMSWEDMKAMMLEELCPRSEMQKLE